ncbi:RcpC/CpaB family pilus assembly protein [Rhodomicrobium vannielii]|uniref:RcpC/CpaB family pilus assembly protein n=1 Tax=Rhodomicrobium vannielii TaxID=1069 RepID=UPI0001C249AF|nr:RcpC/CpaB family pilus assembly protein [Rhodomicrobium vannielii]
MLAVDQNYRRAAEVSLQTLKTVTLEVTSDDAKKLALAATLGQLSLTLNPGGPWKGHDSGIVESKDLIHLHANNPAAVSNDPVVAVTRAANRK